MCDCKSYNWEIGTIPNVMVNMPPFFGIDEEDIICLDACIAEVIIHLWKAGIITKNSCCGHNREAPSIILGNNVDEDTLKRVRKLIVEVDDREFKLLSWKLTILA